jgi:hypothetical protein
VPISIEAIADEQNVDSRPSVCCSLAARTTSTRPRSSRVRGSGQPTGIVTALTEFTGTEIVNALTDDTFALADVYALQGSLPARFRAGLPGWRTT